MNSRNLQNEIYNPDNTFLDIDNTSLCLPVNLFVCRVDALVMR